MFVLLLFLGIRRGLVAGEETFSKSDKLEHIKSTVNGEDGICPLSRLLYDVVMFEDEKTFLPTLKEIKASYPCLLYTSPSPRDS